MNRRPSLFAIFIAALLGLPNTGLYGQAAPSASSDLVGTLESSAVDGENPRVRRDIKPQDVIHWIAQGAESFPETGDLVLLLQLTTEQQFTIYSDKLKWLPPAGWSVSKVEAPPTVRQFDPISQKDVDVFTGGPFRVTLSGPKGTVDSPLKAAVQYVGCTRVICLFPYTDEMTFPVSLGSSQAMGEQSFPSISQGNPPNGETAGALKSTGTFEEEFAKKVKAGSMGLGMLLLIAFAGGVLTNLTPCVAPMIPITIRLLSNQGPRPLFGSSMYALGIVVTYTVLGVIAAMSGALFGNLIANPIVSVSFGLVMALLGFSMLGFGDLTKLQQIGGRIGSSKGGPMNAFLMGTGAGLVASPCTGPILAALLTYTAGKSSVGEATALLGTYSVGFALPYVFLGASAAKISKMRVNYRLQILTKLVFAAVMFGLSLYFLRIPLYRLFMALQPQWAVIAAVGGVVGVGFIGLILASARLQQNKAFMILPSFLLGASLFFGIQHLTRPSTAAHDSVHWYKSEAEAQAESLKTGKRMLVDAWAEWCEACKKMDTTTFADPAVLEELKTSWILYKMDLTEANDANAALQERYDLPGLPTITLLEPGGDLTTKKALNGYVGPESLLQELIDFRNKAAKP